MGEIAHHFEVIAVIFFPGKMKKDLNNAGYKQDEEKGNYLIIKIIAVEEKTVLILKTRQAYNRKNRS
jgi:hypothetical protein